MRDEFRAILAALERGQNVVRIAVIGSNGSTPRSAGACMVVREDGSIVGTIGGGSVEHDSHMAAQEMQPGTSAVRCFDLTNKDAAGLGMVCGGTMRVLLDSMQPSAENVEFARSVLATMEKGEAAAIETLFAHGGTIVDRRVSGGGPAAPQSVPHDDGSLFIEPLPRPNTVHFIGAGHVAQATARIAVLTGFRVAVIDDREDFANAERFPDAACIDVVASLKECMPPDLGPNDHVVIMTRGHLHDRDVLAQALRTEAGYIGMIGSSKKKAAVYESLLDAGYGQDDLDRVHCPIGLSIGAETPEEIAVSIAGELVSSMRGREGR